MKPAGYIMTSASGVVSGTAHRSSLDFWNPKFDKGDTVEAMYTTSQIRSIINDLKANQFGFDDVLAILEENQTNIMKDFK